MSLQSSRHREGMLQMSISLKQREISPSEHSHVEVSLGLLLPVVVEGLLEVCQGFGRGVAAHLPPGPVVVVSQGPAKSI